MFFLFVFAPILMSGAQEAHRGDMKLRRDYQNEIQKEVCERAFGWLRASESKLAACAAVSTSTARAICERGESDNIDHELGLLKSMNCFESEVLGQLDGGDLVKVLDRASQRGWKPDEDSAAMPLPKGGQHNAKGERFQEGDDQLSANCSQYFREIMRQFSGPPFNAGDQWTDGDCSADCFMKRIQKVASTPGGEWRRVDESDAQDLANKGVLVEGVSHYADGHGHLATVFPNSAGADLSQIPGNGPLVRDGNEHPPESQADGRLYPGTWGAIKASKAFDYSRNRPFWYVWVPSTKKI